ncbi:hypothetical protein M1843_04910 [Isoptericola sp. 4D.3]|uniref:Helix-turn-helix domain-containing protein n=1 Tax=Isoptericola peretonis TaxID=2918523 RepID=A0ABT0J0Q8_9MICO|nr:hypothetical protein [Isoptericola sp. 4D.3]
MVTAPAAVELDAETARRWHAVVVEWLVDRLTDPSWRDRRDAGTHARAALDDAERLARVAASGHHPLPVAGGWWSSADVAEHTDTPHRTVRRHMAAGRWPSAHSRAGRWFVRPADVLDELDPAPSPAPRQRDPLADLLPPPGDAVHRALVAVLERPPHAGTPAERAQLAARLRVERARARLYRARRARQLAPAPTTEGDTTP